MEETAFNARVYPVHFELLSSHLQLYVLLKFLLSIYLYGSSSVQCHIILCAFCAVPG